MVQLNRARPRQVVVPTDKAGDPWQECPAKIGEGKEAPKTLVQEVGGEEPEVRVFCGSLCGKAGLCL
jgi:hypothetical protein